MATTGHHSVIDLLDLAESVASDEALAPGIDGFWRGLLAETGLPESLTPATVFDVFASPANEAAWKNIKKHFELIASPGSQLDCRIQSGDVMLRRCEGGLAHAAVVAAPSFWSRDQLAEAGFTADGNGEGIYVQVIEGGPQPHTLADRFVRRVATNERRVPWDTLILRPFSSAERLGDVADESVFLSENIPGDISVAVPDFTTAQRAMVLTPLLDRAQNADAIRWNRQNHPSRSGVEETDIARELQRYVDFSAVRAAIDAFNNSHISAQIALRTPPFDAICIEAIHQFQRKCFVEAAQADGKAGESTLDSLGLIARTGINSVDRVNTTAQQRLNNVSAGLFAATGGEFTAANWFQFMMNPSFLGWRFRNGVHAVLIRKLRIAERHLLSLRAFAGMTPVDLGRAVGFVEEHKGARPTAHSASMHTFGLAADLNYTGNPWVAGHHAAAQANRNTTRAVNHAALLVAGEIANFTAAFLHGLRRQPTGDIFDRLSSLDATLREYLRLDGDNAAIRAVLRARQAASTPGVFRPNETLAAGTARWRGIIRADLQSLRAAGSNFVGRDPRNGFLNLHRDLVIALRQHACLAWGAVDLGASESGDMMHFDCRIDGAGRAVNHGFQPVNGHPCLPAAAGEVSEFRASNNGKSVLPSERLEVFVPREAHTPSGIFFIELEGINCGAAQSVEGGSVIGTIVKESTDSRKFIKKHLGGVTYEPLTLKIGPALVKPVYDWIAAAWNGQTIAKDGALIATTFDLKATSRLEFGHALISEVVIPTMDRASKDPALMTVRLAPEFTTLKPASGAVKAAAAKVPAWLASNFRLQIDGLDSTKVQKIESLAVKLSQTGKIDFPNLAITLPEAAFETWRAWHEDFVIKGNNGDDKEKNGSLTFLAPNLNNELGRINFYNLGIFRLTREVPRDPGQLQRMKAELYCERMEFVGG